MKKRFLSILLAMLMVLLTVTILPITVFAGGNPVSIDGQPYSDVQAAVNAATDGQTIQLNTDCIENVNIPEGKTVTIDLNGNVLQGTGTDSVITVSTGATLTLTDSAPTAEHAGYVDADGLWHLGDTVPEGCTAKTIKGGIITGGKAEYGNGGGIKVDGHFNMLGGNIVGNTAVNGGGVSNSTGTFTMSGGTITDNTATNGGGIYTTFMAINILTGGTVTANVATVGGGLYSKEEMCFAAGTMITMEDGTKKAIETLEIGDVVRVFDHENGEISTAPLFDVWQYPEKHSGVVTLHFSNDIDVTVVGGHSFFDRTANKYVSVTKDNVASYIGHEFYNVDDARWETLDGYDCIDGEVDTYVITSEKHLNCVANGMLSNEDGFYTMVTNIFEYGDGLKIDADKKAEDIEKYGLWDFENTKYISKETYDTLNIQYMSIAFGKGMITKEAFDYLESYWTEVDPELLCGTEEKEEKEKNEPVLFATPLSAILSAPSVEPPTTPGIYVGGTVQIIGNTSGNLYLASGKSITIGTGYSDGNGVAVPEEGFSVGITTATAPVTDTPVQLTANGTEDDVAFFVSDDIDFEVQYNTIGYLELKLHVHNFTGDYIEYDEDNHLWAKACTCGEYDTEDTLTGVDVPQATTELAYTGNEQTGVAEATGYTVTDGKKTAAGEYTATATLSSGYIWSDGTTEAKEINWSIAKAEQVVTIVGDISKVYDMNFVYFNVYSENQLVYFGDGTVTVEYKLATDQDAAYTTTAPINAGSYVVRVSVAEGTNYSEGVATKEFTISKATISKVGFGDITAQPVATETATTTVSGIAIGAKYAGTITWSPALVEEKFGYNTVYSVSIALEITSAYKDNYRFADNVVLVKPTEGWIKSNDSTDSKLIYTKTFEKTGKIPQTVTITDDVSKTYDGKEMPTPTYTKLGDGTVTVEYKLATEQDTAYTTTAPINAGSYVVRVSVAEGTNHLAGVATKEFTISKAPNAIHDLTIGKWKDTETGKAPTVTADFGKDNIVFTYYKGTSKLDAVPTTPGEYTVKAEIVGTDNYDGATAEATFTVYKSQISGGNLGEDETKHVVQIETENGFDPNIVLEVEVVVKADEVLLTDHEAIVEYEELAERFEKIACVYDVRLLLNGVEIQPDALGSGTVVTLRMLIPENLIGKEFRLVHVHASDDVQTIVRGEEADVGTYIIDDGYLVTKIDRFSEFVFTYQPDCSMHWVMIAILALYVAAFAVFTFVMKKKFFVFIASGVCSVATIVLAFFGGCTVCTIFTVVNLVVIAAGACYTVSGKNASDDKTETEQ